MAEPISPVKLRTCTTARIVHNDLELGHGEVEQFRRGHATKEQAIELTWIFRSIVDIKDLNVKRYSRVKLHQPGMCREYRYDELSGCEPDDYLVIQPNSVTTIGRWVLVDIVDQEARDRIAILEAKLNEHNP